MVLVAVASFWIGDGGWSWIHGLSVFTLVMLASGVAWARRGLRARHGRTMVGLYIGALAITGLFTLLPSRLIGRVLHKVAAERVDCLLILPGWRRWWQVLVSELPVVLVTAGGETYGLVVDRLDHDTIYAASFGSVVKLSSSGAKWRAGST